MAKLEFMISESLIKKIQNDFSQLKQQLKLLKAQLEGETLSR